MKSSHSMSNGQCVDVALDKDGNVLVRHSRQLEAGRPCVRYTPAEWEAFILGAKDGEFDYGKLPAADAEADAAVMAGNGRGMPLPRAALERMRS